MDPSTVTLIIGIISCVVGVSTFVSGRMAKAEHNGNMEAKINQALDGISQINRKLEESSTNHHEISLLVQSHEEKIKTLFRQHDDLHTMINESNQTREVLVELLQAIKEKW